MIYEPLFFYNTAKAGDVKPWLGSSYAWSHGGKTLTVQLRHGVKWTDGKPFTSTDVVYTFDLALHSAALNRFSLPLASVSANGQYDVTVNFTKAAYTDAYYALGRVEIVPKHIWQSVKNPATFTNPHPVGLSVEYAGRRPTRAVRNVTIELRRGEVLGIAGESGCGKSTLAYALTRMLKPPALQTSGSMTFYPADGPPVDMLALQGEDLRQFRWSTISMVFQSAMNALNPVDQPGPPVRRHLHGTPPGHRPRGPAGAGPGTAGHGGDRPGPHRWLPARAVRRHAAAGHDRDGAGPEARDRHHG
jgi:Bacterial extracellular solute-binding proteins, family 5 Middle/ABC transporter